jgi:uncharacterized protein (TIGR03437 family)
MRVCVVALAAVLPLCANESGLPVAHTGGFGQPKCDKGGCHRPEPLNIGKTASVRIEVGAYVPGATQQVRVILESTAANRWGFQLTARQRNNNALPAGTFESLNQFVAVRCPSGSFAPCGAGEVQDVTHTSVGSNPGGQPGRQVYGFNWTPPNADIGPVDFAVAALAADGDRGTNSDITATATTASLYAPTNSPTIRSAQGVLHAGALSRNQQTVAPKQLLSIFGTNLNAPGAFIPVSLADFVLGLLPTELGKLSVEFETPGDPNVRLGRMTFVGENQANLQAPDFNPAAANVIRIRPVINRGKGQSEIRGNVIEMPVQRLSPGLFTFGNGSNGAAPGQGPAAAVNGVTGRIIAPPEAGINGSVLARPGDIVLLYGSGFGPTSAEAGAVAEFERIDGVTVTIGNAPAEVQYAGTAPSYVGLQQFNVKVPNLAPGNYAVSVKVSAFVTQDMVFLPVGP